MKIHTLHAATPIQKTYELSPTGDLIKHSYPNIYEFTSKEHVLDPKAPLASLYQVIQSASNANACLFKGELNRTLVKESRAGSTDSEALTSWVCLDLDGVDGYASVDAFLDAIGCGDTSYVLQWSSSMGVDKTKGLHCHIFMLLSRPIHPKLLKYWLIGLNLNTPGLASQLSLTRTGNSLRWPLDVTTCQNDKLLYVAAPHFAPGIQDPYPGNARITLVTKNQATLSPPTSFPSREDLRIATDAKINEIRVANGQPKKRSTKFKYHGSVEYMASPGTATITGIKEERGFVYLNLNGGDSWGYYHPVDNPMFIHNFKGEPSYRTEDLLPEYWAKIGPKPMSGRATQTGVIYLAFRDFRTSNYYNGMYNIITDTLTLAQAKSESQLRQFMEQHGQVLGDFVPDWHLTWDPHSQVVVDPQAKTVNTYIPSEYYLLATSRKVTQIPPTIDKVITHVLGNDAATIDHFLNWLAVIIQSRDKTGTAWVLQGTQGTGKGVLFHHILTPILGTENTVAKRMEELESEFTGFMENKFLVFIDEIEAGKSLYHSKITAKLKNLIVEPTISIRRMYCPPYMAHNFSNMIFASNKPASVEVSPDDRRFNVAPYQTSPIKLTSTEVDTLIPQELEDFYWFLRSYPANADRARKPLISAARDTIVDVSRTALDSIVDAVLAGNAEYLWSHLPSNPKTLNPLMALKYQPFREVLVDIVTNTPNKLTRDELYAIMEWCVGNMPQSPNKFTAVLKHHRIYVTQVWKNGRNTRGIDVNWQIDPAWQAQCLQEIKQDLI